jgi:hypothetical protein
MSMKPRITIIAIAMTMTIALAGMALAGGAPNMKPGLWEITTQAKMQGMTIPPTTITQCLSKDDMVPRAGTQAKQQNCKVTDVKVSGDTVTWSMRCKGEGGGVESKGSITYHGDRFEGNIITTVGGSGMTIRSTMTGRRLGECN